MGRVRIIAIGDNVCDKYLSRGLMYPGGQCVNTCAYARLNGAEAAYLGKFGNDSVAECVQTTLSELGIDSSHCRKYKGENGFALVTLDGNDRVFLGSNKGGVAKAHRFDFSKDDLEYISGYQLIYTNLNSYIENDLPLLRTCKRPIAYDFSNKWTDGYLDTVCPYIDIAMLSCAHLSPEEREREMAKVANRGVPIVLGTIGEKGSYVLYKGHHSYCPAKLIDNAIDTMGAGDAYFAAFLVSLCGSAVDGRIFDCPEETMLDRIILAMSTGASFAAEVCKLEGAFGHGVPIQGRTAID
jgi:fructoselysine 6-kinase